MIEPRATYAHQVAPALRVLAETTALRRRQEVRPDRAPQDAHETAKFERADAGRIFVRGRAKKPWGVVWDVLRVHGPGRVELVAEDIPFQQEAISVANDTLAGRIRVSFAGVAGAFRRAAGGLVVPDASVRPAEPVLMRKASAEPGEVSRIEIRRAPRRG